MCCLFISLCKYCISVGKFYGEKMEKDFFSHLRDKGGECDKGVYVYAHAHVRVCVCVQGACVCVRVRVGCVQGVYMCVGVRGYVCRVLSWGFLWKCTVLSLVEFQQGHL